MKEVIFSDTITNSVLEKAYSNKIEALVTCVKPITNDYHVYPISLLELMLFKKIEEFPIITKYHKDNGAYLYKNVWCYQAITNDISKPLLIKKLKESDELVNYFQINDIRLLDWLKRASLNEIIRYFIYYYPHNYNVLSYKEFLLRWDLKDNPVVLKWFLENSLPNFWRIPYISWDKEPLSHLEKDYGRGIVSYNFLTNDWVKPFWVKRIKDYKIYSKELLKRGGAIEIRIDLDPYSPNANLAKSLLTDGKTASILNKFRDSPYRISAFDLKLFN